MPSSASRGLLQHRGIKSESVNAASTPTERMLAPDAELDHAIQRFERSSSTSWNKIRKCKRSFNSFKYLFVYIQLGTQLRPRPRFVLRKRWGEKVARGRQQSKR